MLFLVERNIDSSVSNVEMTGYDIKSMIYVVRNQQVMIDNDLAMLYQVETRILNQAVKRNITRFPERFRFQLTKDEYKNLKSQIVMSGSDEESNGYGGRRTLPFADTYEQMIQIGHNPTSVYLILTFIYFILTLIML